MSREPRISDIPTFKKALEEAKNVVVLKRAMPLIGPLLSLLGVDVNKIEGDFANKENLLQHMEELASIPDRFNKLFAPRGWIAFDAMNLEIAKSAVENAELGKTDEAEMLLVEHYSPKVVKWQLLRMKSIAAFRPRQILAGKALIDYQEERYHACVPVVLALLDGLVNELHEKRRGFFANEVDITAWDSVAAHSSGLNILSGIFKKGRQKTVTEQITIPYRNGIMHGMDLGYDNKIVAAKTWAALFATSEWASKAERGLLREKAEEPPATWKEIIQKLKENKENRERLDAWRRRGITVGIDCPITGKPEDFEKATPERKLVEFLSYWKVRNYGHMARCLDPKFGATATGNPGEIRMIYAQVLLKAFSLVEINDKAPATTEICTELVYEKEGEEWRKTIEYRLVNTDDGGNVEIRGKNGTSWGIINWNWIYF